MRCPVIEELPRPARDKSGWPWISQKAWFPATLPNGKPWPLISIITPNYNYGEYIEETIRSVLLQGYPATEYIIIDDGSCDNSSEIIRKYESWISCWITRQNRGQSFSINEGFSKAHGEILGWLNSDDMLNSNALFRVAAFFAEHPDCKFLTGDGEIVDSSARKTEYYIKAHAYSFQEMLQYCRGKYLPQPSVFFSKEAYDSTGGLDCSLHHAMDLDLWLRFRKKYELCHIPVSLSRLRHHDKARTWRYNENAMKEVREVVVKHLDKIKVRDGIMIHIGTSYMYASAVCRGGLKAYFTDTREKAMAMLRKSFFINPLIIFSLPGLSLLFRLLLPRAVKKLFFRNP